MKIEPLFNNVLIKIQEQESEKMYGNLIMPDLGREKSRIAKVIAIGPGFYTMMGSHIPTTVKVGDIVVVPKMGFQTLVLDKEEYEIGKENDLLSILKLENE